MKSVIFAVLTFIGGLILAALIRGITKDVVGPGLISLVINIATIYALFYIPYKVYKSNKQPKELE
jgi:multisubunit Na+/H+ antiporter MnhE subunit